MNEKELLEYLIGLDPEEEDWHVGEDVYLTILENKEVLENILKKLGE
jgi:hypothetical protein